MIFSSNSDRRKVNPLIYIKFWGQACLLSLLYSTELFTLRPTLLKLEHCQQWFLQNVFYVPKFAPKQLLLKLSGLKSIETEITLRGLLFSRRLLSGDKMTPVVRELFEIKANSYFDTNPRIPTPGYQHRLSWEFCPVYVRHYTSMIFLIILTHDGIKTRVSRPMLHGKLLWSVKSENSKIHEILSFLITLTWAWLKLV